MVNHDLQKYWALTKAHRHGSKTALVALELLSKGNDRGARLAQIYLLQNKAGPTEHASSE